MTREQIFGASHAGLQDAGMTKTGQALLQAAVLVMSQRINERMGSLQDHDMSS